MTSNSSRVKANNSPIVNVSSGCTAVATIVADGSTTDTIPPNPPVPTTTDTIPRIIGQTDTMPPAGPAPTTMEDEDETEDEDTEDDVDDEEVDVEDAEDNEELISPD